MPADESVTSGQTRTGRADQGDGRRELSFGYRTVAFLGGASSSGRRVSPTSRHARHSERPGRRLGSSCV